MIAETELKKEKVNEEMGDLKSKLEELTNTKAECSKGFKECSKEYDEAKKKLDKNMDKMSNLIKEDEKLVEDYRHINKRIFAYSIALSKLNTVMCTSAISSNLQLENQTFSHLNATVQCESQL